MAISTSTRPLPTDAELAILALLWRLGPSTVRAVHEASGGKTGYTTALKTLQIMTGKGLVHRDESARSHVYRAAVPPEATQTRLVSALMTRAFSGSAAQLAMRALSTSAPSRRELNEVRALLDRLEAAPRPKRRSP